MLILRIYRGGKFVSLEHLFCCTPGLPVDAIRTAVIVAVDAPYFTRTVSVDAVRTAVIVAVDSSYFTRTVSVDAICTAVIVAVDAPYFTYVFQTVELCHSYIALCIYHPTPPTTVMPLYVYKTVLCF